MNKDQKYYGEVWFPEAETNKKFGVLTFKEDDILIETNLNSQERVFGKFRILGAFNGLGYVTFIGCTINHHSVGLIESKIYCPKYSIISASHFIKSLDIQIKEFSIVNDAIVRWVNHFPSYDDLEDKLVLKNFKQQFIISEKEMSIGIEYYNAFKSKRSELTIKNRGSVNFYLEKATNVLDAIELYNSFQKILQLLNGGSAKFETFRFKCPDCDEWQELYYNDKKLTRSNSNYVHIEYKTLENDLNEILHAVFLNKNFAFCLDKMMENFISVEISHNKRFTNSIAAFEAYGKLYLPSTKQSLSHLLNKCKETFMLIGKFDEIEWEMFPSKVVRSRDYHIHSNIANQNVYSEFELLYISYLLDFVIGYLLLDSLNVSPKILEMFVLRGNSCFSDQQAINKHINSLKNSAEN